MGMYTELIFGAELKKETPEQVINALKYIIGELEDKPDDFPLPEGRCENVLRSSSYYFGISKSLSKIWFDKISKSWKISSRSNIKNYENEIEMFLEWIKSHIERGSGAKDMYAITIYEEDFEPTIYYLHPDRKCDSRYY
ncbi:hypothetical protein UFOVP286_13 [uncultured Caudovirales phage]|uniref:Uncharacterized protein n=1 Tax=uncultured Caudovirales phage TaxID=2100421 RepID=A0A6J5LNA6_9CAUD|nr:hypothetical protein UFOVP286_13 [uncultured Caudovirales phage]